MINPDFSNFPILYTENFFLRNLLLSDAEAIYELRSDDEINKYLNRQKARSVEDAIAHIERIENNIRNNEAIAWTICYNNTSKLLGTICLWNIQPEIDSAEIGFELLPQFHGKGVMQEVIPAIIAYAFEQLQLKRIEATVHKHNTKSVKLLERNNFIKTDMLIADEPDVIVYELLR